MLAYLIVHFSLLRSPDYVARISFFHPLFVLGDSVHSSLVQLEEVHLTALAAGSLNNTVAVAFLGSSLSTLRHLR